MNKAIIINGKPHCPISKKLLDGRLTGEYKQVIHDGKSYTMFERFCECGCRMKYTYQADIRLDNTLYYSFDKVEIIKESKGEIKDVDTER